MSSLVCPSRRRLAGAEFRCIGRESSEQRAHRALLFRQTSCTPQDGRTGRTGPHTLWGVPDEGIRCIRLPRGRAPRPTLKQVSPLACCGPAAGHGLGTFTRSQAMEASGAGPRLGGYRMGALAAAPFGVERSLRKASCACRWGLPGRAIALCVCVTFFLRIARARLFGQRVLAPVLALGQVQSTILDPPVPLAPTAPATNPAAQLRKVSFWLEGCATQQGGGIRPLHADIADSESTSLPRNAARAPCCVI